MRRRRTTIAIVGLVLTVATLAAYWPVGSCDFVDFDDGASVFDNGPVKQGLSIYGWMYAWTTWDLGNWIPMTWLSLELDSSLWGISPAGYHATNLFFHVTNVLLLFVTLNRLTGSLWRSACVAGFFALHPLHVESVAWISERKDVLSACLMLLTILAYDHYVKSPNVARYLLVALLFTLGLLAKPMLVTLPILLLLIDQWPLNRICSTDVCNRPQVSLWTAAIEKVPLLCLSLIDGIITIYAQHIATNAVQHLSFVSRMANVFSAYGWYLHKTLLPAGLVAFYPHPGQDIPWNSALAGLALVVLLTVVSIRFRRTRPHLFFGWIWFVVSLLPVIGLFQVGSQAYADRYVYIPHIGLFVAIVWQVHSWMTSKPVQFAVVAFSMVCMAACGWLTHRQVQYWRNSESLWLHALEMDPKNGFAHINYASVALQQGRHEEAIEHVSRGLELFPTKRLASPYCAWGMSLAALNRPAEAEEMYRQALRIDPKHVPTLEAMWKLLTKQERPDEGRQMRLRMASALADNARNRPYCALSQMNLGHFEAGRGNPRGALPYFKRATRLSPANAETYFNLAIVQLTLGDFENAKQNLEQTIRLAPEMALAHYRLAEINARSGDHSGARDHFREAARLEPDNLDYQQQLGAPTDK